MRERASSSRRGTNNSSWGNVVSDFAMDFYPVERNDMRQYSSNLVAHTFWTHSSWGEEGTEFLALSSMLLVIAMAVRNVCGEGTLLSSGDCDLEPIGNLKLQGIAPSLFSSSMKLLIVWLYKSCYYRVEKIFFLRLVCIEAKVLEVINSVMQ